MVTFNFTNPDEETRDMAECFYGEVLDVLLPEIDNPEMLLNACWCVWVAYKEPKAVNTNKQCVDFVLAKVLSGPYRRGCLQNTERPALIMALDKLLRTADDERQFTTPPPVPAGEEEHKTDVFDDYSDGSEDDELNPCEGFPCGTGTWAAAMAQLKVLRETEVEDMDDGKDKDWIVHLASHHYSGKQLGVLETVSIRKKAIYVAGEDFIAVRLPVTMLRRG